MRMLLALSRGPAFVSELAAELGVRLAHAAQQLAVLREANLVKARRCGRQVEYSLADHHVDKLVAMVVAFAERRR